MREICQPEDEQPQNHDRFPIEQHEHAPKRIDPDANQQPDCECRHRHLQQPYPKSSFTTFHHIVIFIQHTPESSFAPFIPSCLSTKNRQRDPSRAALSLLILKIKSMKQKEACYFAVFEPLF
jgi:hypothetical protein